MADKQEFQQQLQQIEQLIDKIERSADPSLRAKAQELVRLIMAFHTSSLDRMMEIICQAGEAGRVLVDRLGTDDLVGSLLVMHGLHPVDFDTRVRSALEKVRPYLKSHGGNVELLDINGGRVRLRLAGSCHGCASSAMTLKLAIEEAIYAAAPDVIGLDVEGVREAPPSPLSFVPVESLQASHPNGSPAVARDSGGWREVRDLESLIDGSTRIAEIAGRPILFCRLGTTFYAYGSVCADCGHSLEGAKVETAALVCPSCGQSYDVMRAGQALGQPALHLEPFPLLIEKGCTRVALPG
ncbi:MAG: NifU family protein [Acidobacteriota bacterium]